MESQDRLTQVEVDPVGLDAGELARERFLRRAAAEVNETSLSLSTRLLRLAELAGTATHADNVVLYVCDPASVTVQELVIWGLSSQDAQWLRGEIVGMNLSRLEATRSLADGRTVEIEDTLASPDTASLHARFKVRSLVGVPLAVEDQWFGALFVHSRSRPRAFTSEYVGLLEELSRQATMALVAARLYEESEASRLLKDRMLRRATRAHELERQAVASELRTTVVEAQAVALVAMEEAEKLLEAGDLDAARELLGTSRGRARDVLSAVRSLSSRLVSTLLEEQGLVAALKTLARDVRGSCDGEVSLAASLEGRLDADAELALYRICQESVENARRHGCFQKLQISLHPDGEGVRLKVSDDGDGFTLPAADQLVDHGLFGLATMFERAALVGGQLDITSAPGRGTTVEAWVPCEFGLRTSG